MSRLVVMGSGETAPTMVRVHREILGATPAGPAVMLDTPFAFQMNRAELVARTRLYFAESVGREIQAAAWPPTGEDPSGGDRALALIDSACWVFAGPGSPTYALGKWRGTPVPAALAAVVRRGGTLVLGSAAAVTLGSHAVPVYEIYKVGTEPAWAPGLDLLGDLAGIPAAVVPHYDNREGGSHDTRFCYLGEPRLARLEALLPGEVGVVGVDEHTAVVIDLAAGAVAVRGSGVLSVRRRGHTTTVAGGETLGLDQFRDLVRGAAGAAGRRVGPTSAGPATPDPAQHDVPSVRHEAERLRAVFDAALDNRDLPAAVTAVLDLEAAIAAWSADTLQSDDLAEARRVLRALVVRLGEVAERGGRDPRQVLGPYVEALLELRAAARAAHDFSTSDRVRDRLVDLGVEVRDTADGVEWQLRPPSRIRPRSQGA